MSEKLLLIDGHSILNRAFFGLPDLTNSEGLHTNAVYGFLNMLFRMLDEEQPDYLTVAFDVHAPTFRHKMYDAYKGTRKPMDPSLREQVPLMKEVLGTMGIPIVTREGYEADDILGTLAQKAEEKGLDVTIFSGDRDLLQLATDRVQIRIPKTKGGKTTIENYYAKDVLEAYQLEPKQIIDLKGLMGDSSDNIPGLPGVGEKTATKLLLAYGSVENAHAHMEEIKPKKAMEAFRDHYDLAVLSKELATIHTDSPVECDYEAARLGDLYTPEAYECFRRLDFKNLLSRFDQANRVQELPEVTVVEDFNALQGILNTAGKDGVLGVHLLEDGKEIYGLALAGEQLSYIPVQGFVTGDYLVSALGELLANASDLSAFALKPLLKQAPAELRENWFDTHLAAYLLNPLKSVYTYDDIAKEYSGMVIPAAEELFDGKKMPPVGKMTEEQRARLSAYTALSARLTKEPLEQALRESGMEELYRTIEMPLVVTISAMEREGVLVQKEELKAYGENLEGRIRELEQEIYRQAGEEFNILSPKQLGVILFEKMGLPGGKKTKTGYSTAADILEKLAPEAPIVASILEYRQLTKLKSTYAEGLSAFIDTDGRIRSTFHQTITATGRLSSADPNLQNIPVRMELGRQIRKVFVPKEGCVFVDADYSQIELRILAHMSGDEKLIKAYNEASDIHAITASQVFHVPFEEVTPLQRRNAKAVNFGIVYGISSFGLSQDLDISRQEAQEYINSYFETYPGIKKFLDDTVADAKEKGYSITLYGRRRPLPELSSGNFMQRQFGERVAMNAPIQGTAADIMKIAMNRVAERLKTEQLKARLLLQVHDELLIETPLEEEEQVRDILKEEMMHAADLSVPLEIDMHSGSSWYEAK
ncbi:MAG: DNA polymerase I [Lachnospiraceae bacterium]|nr:DNA polymerase I [Lachnospiraceae bacterium]